MLISILYYNCVFNWSTNTYTCDMCDRLTAHFHQIYLKFYAEYSVLLNEWTTHADSKFLVEDWTRARYCQRSLSLNELCINYQTAVVTCNLFTIASSIIATLSMNIRQDHSNIETKKQAIVWRMLGLYYCYQYQTSFAVSWMTCTLSLRESNLVSPDTSSLLLPLSYTLCIPL